MRKPDCLAPCEWNVGVGCRAGARDDIVVTKSAKGRTRSQAKQVGTAQREIDRLQARVSELNASLSELKRLLKSKSRELDDLRATKHVVNGSKDSAKLNMSLMTKLNQRTLLLNSRLQTVEERLKVCNRKYDVSQKELETCRKLLDDD